MAGLFARRLRQVAGMVRREGIVKTLRMVSRRLVQGPANPIDVLSHYAFVRNRSLALAPGVAPTDSLLWFIPDFSIGSGGHLNIFRTIWHLEKMGYESSIVIVEPVRHHDAAEAEAEIKTHFLPLRARVYVGLENLPPSEFAIATGWQTAYPVRWLAGSVRKIYFVQDFEPFFYPVGSESVLAENTYRFGFFGITAGGWLASKLARDYGMETHPVGFGVELERYRRLPRRQPEQQRVFFYARPPTPRRAFELGLLVLDEIWRRRPDTHFILAGWDTTAYHVPFPHLPCGTLALDQLPEIYSQCDVALVVSLTNLSLLPLELMACGCPVVSNRGENVEWLLSEGVAALAESSVESLADAVCRLLDDDAARQALSRSAEAFARGQTWDVVARQFASGLEAAREVQPCAA